MTTLVRSLARTLTGLILLTPLTGASLSTFTYSGAVTQTAGLPAPGFTLGNLLTGSLSFDSAAITPNAHLGPADLRGFSFALAPDSFSMSASNFLEVANFSATVSSDTSTFTSLSFSFEFDPLIRGAADAHGSISAQGASGGLDVSYAFNCTGTATEIAVCQLRDYQCTGTAIQIAVCQQHVPAADTTNIGWTNADLPATTAPEPRTGLLEPLAIVAIIALAASKRLSRPGNKIPGSILRG